MSQSSENWSWPIVYVTYQLEVSVVAYCHYTTLHSPDSSIHILILYNWFHPHPLPIWAHEANPGIPVPHSTHPENALHSILMDPIIRLLIDVLWLHLQCTPPIHPMHNVIFHVANWCVHYKGPPSTTGQGIKPRQRFPTPLHLDVAARGRSCCNWLIKHSGSHCIGSMVGDSLTRLGMEEAALGAVSWTHLAPLLLGVTLNFEDSWFLPCWM